LELLASWMEADFSEQVVTAVVRGNAANTAFVGTGASRFILKHEGRGAFAMGESLLFSVCQPRTHLRFCLFGKQPPFASLCTNTPRDRDEV
jgi:hypothetical protein